MLLLLLLPPWLFPPYSYLLGVDLVQAVHMQRRLTVCSSLIEQPSRHLLGQTVSSSPHVYAMLRNAMEFERNNNKSKKQCNFYCPGGMLHQVSLQMPHA